MNETSPSKIWLLRIVLPGRWGRWLTSMMIFAVFYSVQALAGVFQSDGSESTSASTAGLFFCVLLSYVIPIYHFIDERSHAAMRSLASVVDVDIAQVTLWENAISHKSAKWSRIVLLLGVSAGMGHNWLMWGSVDVMILNFSSPPLILLTINTVVIWISMTFVISGLVDNALLFNRTARHLRIDLLNSRSLTPFGSVAVSSTLAMIGTQASYPLLMIDQGFVSAAMLPGIILTSVPMVLLFILPIWPVHRRLAAAKQAELEHLFRQIQAAPRMQENQTRALETLIPLLAYRREINQVSEWPFDIGVVTRLILYLIIPPLTWVATALIENLVSAAL